MKNIKSTALPKIDNNTFYLLVIVLIGFFIRLAYILSTARNLFFNYLSDSALYHTWALEILKTGSSNWANFLGPLYPTLIAIVYKITGPSQTNGLIFNLILDLITIYVIYLTARRTFNHRAGLISSFIYALYAPAIFYCGLFLMSTLLAFFNVLVAYLIVKGYQEKNYLTMAGAGLVSGIEALAQANIIFFLPVLMAILFAARRYLLFLIYLISLLLPVSYNSIKNSIISREFTPLAGNLGINFFIGNNEDADGFYQKPKGLDLSSDFTGQKIASKISGRPLKQMETSNFWLSMGLKFLFTRPGRAAILFIKKILFYFNHLEIPQAENFYFARNLSPILKFDPLTFGFIGVFTILGFFIFWSDPNRRILLLFILTLAFSYIIFFVIGRLRQPVVPLFVLLCGCSIDWLILKISEKDIKALKIYIPLLILSTLLVWLPKYKYEIEWLNAMTESDHSIYLMYQKRFKESETLLRNIIKKDRNFAPAYNNLGNLYLRTGQVRKAIPYYNEAIKLDSTEGDYHANLGVAYLLTGQLELGERELKIGKKLLPYYLAIEDHLKQLYEISDATRLNPAEGYLIIAENAISIGDLDLAIEFFEKSLAIQPRSLRAINDGAVAYYQKKNFTRAIDLLIQGVEYFPDNIDLLYNLGIMYYEKGEKVNALAAWQKIIKIDPTNKRISELIEKTEKELKGTSSPKVGPK